MAVTLNLLQCNMAEGLPIKSAWGKPQSAHEVEEPVVSFAEIM